MNVGVPGATESGAGRSEVEAQQGPPRVAFIGFCDRSAEINEGHNVFWHKNILGLSSVKVFPIFPVSLGGLYVMLAIYNGRVGEEFRLLFREVGGIQSLDIHLKLGSAIKVRGNEQAQPLSAGESLLGWNCFVEPFPNDLSPVQQPGVYDVFLADGGSEQFLAQIAFFHLPTPSLTPESVAAIRSNPLAIKFVRYRIGCKKCGDAVRAYAGVEKNAELESQGWVWFENLPDRFKCGCGSLDITLQYIKTGLHGILNRRLNPLSDPHINSIRLYEQSALEEDIRQFKILIDKDSKEEDLQVFLEKHPIFFSFFLPTKLMFKPPILTKYKSDFAILTSRRELLLIEIERAALRVLKKDGGVHSQLQHPLDQVRDWLRTFDDHRAAALEAMNLTLGEVAIVRGVVIAGRTPKDSKQERTFRNLSIGERISVCTYDDLLSAVQEIVRQTASA